MSDDEDRVAILARRGRFIAVALAGLGGCAAESPPQAPKGEVAVLPVATTTASTPAVDLTDTDGDGVLDKDDQCPRIPSGERVDTEHPGCPKPLACLTIHPQATLQIVQKIRFGRSSVTISPRFSALLDEISRALDENPKLDVDVLGHCEKGEPPSFAKRRAEAVRDALVKRGVEKARLSVREGECEAPSEDARMVEFPNLREREKPAEP